MYTAGSPRPTAGCAARVAVVSTAASGSERRSNASAVNNDSRQTHIKGKPAAQSAVEPVALEPSAVQDLTALTRGERCCGSARRVDTEYTCAAGRGGFSGAECSNELPESSARRRPIAWRLLLGVLDDKDDTTRSPRLAQQRAQYKSWKREYMGPRESHCQGSDSGDAALLKGIAQDICRTRSELEFFAVGGMAHQWMLRILFVHAKLHPDVGYMQGMNEILAPILFVYGGDPDEAWSMETEADAFFSFQSIVASIKLLYLPAPSNPSKTGADLQMNRLMQLLRQHDPALWQHLNSIGVTPDLFSLRWYTVLLAREFSMPTTLRIWDALLSDPKRFSLLHYVNCALIRCRRSSLLRLGFTAALQCLHTAPPSGVDVDQLLRDAALMRARDRSIDKARAE